MSSRTLSSDTLLADSVSRVIRAASFLLVPASLREWDRTAAPVGFYQLACRFGSLDGCVYAPGMYASFMTS